MKKYIHYRNKKEYEFVDTCKIQENGEWVIGIIYCELGGNMLFVRSLSEWINKFEEVE